MKRFNGQIALVTGASSGIGMAFAEKLAANGADLILTARSTNKLNELGNRLSAQYQIQVKTIAIDLSQPGSAQSLFRETKKENLSVDLLVNNAGFGKWGSFLEFDSQVYHEMLHLNINSVVELTQLFLPNMLSNQSGGIINVASTAAFLPVPYAAVYSASKSFVLYFSEALHGEYYKKGINVLALCPGGTKSNFASVANQKKTISTDQYETPEVVAENGLNAFLKNKPYVVSGTKNYLTTIIPRLLSRRRVIHISGDAWKKMI
ncbi:SDR family oxidoreductase [Hazenella sp. IB182357]|uniref:NADP-dependent 3-hydroxy acid dehydrogenase YdfG n=1 Tax=Polycladospora coralii TaxID=2771432 RepID=A0A926NAV3_9BACL|nr:SDR family oxidoreductase [Polycladospora coralii]MBD1372250.1 SDR family oxidoreductase [Polycladospora coralii]